MKRNLPLVVLGLVVVAGLGFLIVKLRTPPGAAPAPRAAAAPPAEAVRDHRGPGAPPTDSPSLPAERAPYAEGRASSPSSPRVADHRGAPRPKVADTRYRIAPTIVGATRLAVRPIVKRCATEHASELGPDRPRLQTVVRARIQSGVLTIAELEIQTRDLPESGDLVECVRRGLEGFQLPAADQPDVDGHPLTFPFDLPLP